MRVIAVANQKGGVGKTTVTRELSACCALRGYQILVIDCDPQANLTASWVEPDIYNVTLSHVLIEPEANAGAKLEPLNLDDAIVESPLTNLDLVPADIRLARFEMQPDYLAHRLTKQIREHACGYDLVFIDCPPQLGKLLTAALYSAQCVLVPCAADLLIKPAEPYLKGKTAICIVPDGSLWNLPFQALQTERTNIFGSSTQYITPRPSRFFAR